MENLRKFQTFGQTPSPLFLSVGPGDCQNCSGSGSTRHVLLVGFAIKKMKK